MREAGLQAASKLSGKGAAEINVDEIMKLPAD
jgi:hypothetical protein